MEGNTFSDNAVKQIVDALKSLKTRQEVIYPDESSYSDSAILAFFNSDQSSGLNNLCYWDESSSQWTEDTSNQQTVYDSKGVSTKTAHSLCIYLNARWWKVTSAIATLIKGTYSGGTLSSIS